MNLLSIIIILFNLGFADDRFNSLRQDFNVPAHCEEFKLDFFKKGSVERFYYGREDALNMGFTFEYPLDRQDATLLWEYFRGMIKGTPSLDLFKKIKDDPAVYRDYKIIMANYAGMGIDFHNEGDVLEVLATFEMRNRFPAPLYFITGGIEYRENKGGRTIGEIDIYVGHAKDCAAILVGEVKLGSGKMLTKAKEQLERFSRFLVEQGTPALQDEVNPNYLEKCTQIIQN